MRRAVFAATGRQISSRCPIQRSFPSPEGISGGFMDRRRDDRHQRHIRLLAQGRVPPLRRTVDEEELRCPTRFIPTGSSLQSGMGTDNVILFRKSVSDPPLGSKAGRAEVTQKSSATSSPLILGANLGERTMKFISARNANRSGKSGDHAGLARMGAPPSLSLSCRMSMISSAQAYKCSLPLKESARSLSG